MLSAEKFNSRRELRIFDEVCSHQKQGMPSALAAHGSDGEWWLLADATDCKGIFNHRLLRFHGFLKWIFTADELG